MEMHGSANAGTAGSSQTRILSRAHPHPFLNICLINKTARSETVKVTRMDTHLTHQPQPTSQSVYLLPTVFLSPALTESQLKMAIMCQMCQKLRKGREDSSIVLCRPYHMTDHVE